MTTKKRTPSAGARIKAAGKSLVWATFTGPEKEKIRAAAGISGMAMSQFLQIQGLMAAEKVLEKFRNNS